MIFCCCQCYALLVSSLIIHEYPITQRSVHGFYDVFEAHHGCVWYYVRSRIRCTHQDEVKWAKKLHHQRPFPLWKDLSISISRFSRLYKSTFTFASSIPLSRDQQTKLSLGCVAFKAFKAFSSVWHSSQSSAKGGEIHINSQHQNESNSNKLVHLACESTIPRSISAMEILPG